MKNGKAFAIAGVSLAVLVGLYLVLKPKKAAAQKDDGLTPISGDTEGCPPTFVRCENWNTTKKCYNPLLVNSQGLYPNGTNPCAEEIVGYGYGYTDIGSQNPGADDTIFG